MDENESWETESETKYVQVFHRAIVSYVLVLCLCHEFGIINLLTVFFQLKFAKKIDLTTEKILFLVWEVQQTVLIKIQMKTK